MHNEIKPSWSLRPTASTKTDVGSAKTRTRISSPAAAPGGTPAAPRKRPSWRLWVLHLLVFSVLALGYGQLDRAAPPAASVPVTAPTTAPPGEREAREAAYDRDVAALTALIEAEGTDRQARQDATLQLQRLIAQHQTELALGAALEQAGYAPCMALCQNDSLTIVLPQRELESVDAAAILSLCAAHADVALENIRLMTQ